MSDGPGIMKIHGIGTVTQKTGLSTHTIRAWERRYGAVVPERTDGNQRLYSDMDIRRLGMLKKATDAGISISRAAGLDDTSLEALVAEGIAPGTRREPLVTSARFADFGGLIDEAISCVRRLDATGLTRVLRRATLDHGTNVVLDRLIGVMGREIGDRWESGELRIYHEHLASVVFRSYLARIIENQTDSDGAVVVSTTPAGQRHEIGAMLCAAVAVTEGLRTRYLGPETPADEIVAPARELPARFIVLSLSYPREDEATLRELRRIRSALTGDVRIVIGGSAAGWYREHLDDGFETASDMHGLRELFRNG